MEYYKVEERIYSYKIKDIDISSDIAMVNDLVEKRDLEKLKTNVQEKILEINTDNYEKIFANKEQMSKQVSHTGWGVPYVIKRSDEIYLFDQCVYWRNEYIEMILEQKGVK